nr:uncharacterized protein LOC128705931 [Cherax quadricarinatus]
MNVEMAERFEDITKEKLQNLKLQSCWQLARSLGIKYDRHFTAQTVRCMIQNVLFPDEQDPEIENGEADIPSFLNSFLQTPEAETTTLTTPLETTDMNFLILGNATLLQRLQFHLQGLYGEQNSITLKKRIQASSSRPSNR